MNKDQVSGRAETAKGKVKEVVGTAVDSDKMKSEGRLDQATGKVQSSYGDAKETAKDVAKDK